jgi:hypothetical protein
VNRSRDYIKKKRVDDIRSRLGRTTIQYEAIRASNIRATAVGNLLVASIKTGSA